MKRVLDFVTNKSFDGDGCFVKYRQARSYVNDIALLSMQSKQFRLRSMRTISVQIPKLYEHSVRTRESTALWSEIAKF